MLENAKHIHFIGVGGSGMSPLAHILNAMGYTVSGSDLAYSQNTKTLAAEGVRIAIGHDPNLIADCDVVVVSTAITAENVELIAAQKAGKWIIHRSELLALLLNERYGIAVAGAHGKTTVTSMLALVLDRAGLDPTVVIGGHLNGFGMGAKFGRGRFLVAEADESDGSFLRYNPVLAVITNIEADHLEHYGGDFRKLVRTYNEFLHNIRANGLAVLGVDSPEVRQLANTCPRRYVTYALHQPADYQAKNIKLAPGTAKFTVQENGLFLGEVVLNVPGEHNIANALATIAVAREMGLDLREIAAHLTHFQGAKRRFQIIGRAGDVLVVDDYAHHPTEIRATLKAAKGWGRHVWAVFQPHRYSRTHDLFTEFSRAFSDADELILTDIYAPPPEQPIPGVSSAKLAERIAAEGKSVQYLAKGEIIAYLEKKVQPGDLVIMMGAGDIWQVAAALAERLEQVFTHMPDLEAAALLN